MAKIFGVEHQARTTTHSSIVNLQQKSSDSSFDLHQGVDDVEELEEHIIMAIDRNPGGTFGCAYYIARSELLCCMHDVDHSESETLNMLKLDIEPTTILYSPRMYDTDITSAYQKPSLADNVVDSYEVIMRPGSDFNYGKAVNRLRTLPVSSGSICFMIPGENTDYREHPQADEPGFIDQQGRLLTLTCNLDLENSLSIGCAGAVICHLQRKRASEYLQDDPAADLAYRISNIEMFTLQNTMLVNKDALFSLQILQAESHPNIVNQHRYSSGSKESLSVYGLFQQFARTSQGKKKLRQMFLRPSIDMKTISDRHDFVSVFLYSENQKIAEMLSKSLRRIKNMQTVTTSLRKGVERGNSDLLSIRSGVWAALLEFCYHGIDIVDTVKEVVGHKTIGVLITTEDILDKRRLQQVGKLIHDVVDLEASLEQNRTMIKRGVNANLDSVRDFYNGMEELLAGVASDITNEMPAHIDQRLNVVFLPTLGYHVTVPLTERNGEPIWEGDGSWERRFRTEKYQYFKNDTVRGMDSEWGDLHAMICDIEIEISYELAQQVLQHQDWLVVASDFCGDLDSLLAFVHSAVEFNLNRPKMVNENIIDIKKGRHLLQQMTVSSYVPNDTYFNSADGTASMILITGPNYSGKSVYKKQVALIVYLAQIGSFVPADTATLGITDKLFTRINTVESVSRIQSAFVIDLQQIAMALKSCTSRSLFVIDEFGKGTDNCDGAGLAAGVFTYLLNLGPESPRVLASTHFHEIFERGQFDHHPNVALAHMEVYLQDSSDQNQLTYLYNLRNGRSILSYGNHCAAMYGVPRAVIDRGMLLTDLIIRGEDLVTACSLLSQVEIEELEDAEAICRAFLAMDLDSTDNQRMLNEFQENPPNRKSLY